MSGIARILVDRGFPVSGSDARDSPVLAGLAERGVRTAVGHDAANLELLAGGPTAVVVSTAVRPDNPEVLGRPGGRHSGGAAGGRVGRA